LSAHTRQLLATFLGYILGISCTGHTNTVILSPLVSFSLSITRFFIVIIIVKLILKSRQRKITTSLLENIGPDLEIKVDF
jgi:hypothetical protein